jgi:hypothetical protein
MSIPITDDLNQEVNKCLIELHRCLKFRELDKTYNRIATLSAIASSKFLGKDYVKEHILEISSFLRTNQIHYSELEPNVFSSNEIFDTDLMKLNSRIYSIIIDDNKECILYLINLATRHSKPLEIKRLHIDEISQDTSGKPFQEYILRWEDTNEKMRSDLSLMIKKFYLMSNHSSKNETIKKVCLINMEKVGNLQNKYYNEFIQTLDLETLEYGL